MATATPSRASLIGVAVAVSGNVLISLALNCQKLAHVRLEQNRIEEERRLYEHDDDDEFSDDAEGQEEHGVETQSVGRAASPENEATPFLRSKQAQVDGYGSATESSTLQNTPDRTESPQHLEVPKPRDHRVKIVSLATSSPPSARNEEDNDGDDEAEGHKRWSRTSSSSQTRGTKFLRSKLWWLGIGLMILGEFGNFLSYGFAPASLVAPLGAVALLSNVIISPFLLHEKFKAADVGGIFLAIIGAVTVVFSSKQNDERLSPGSLLAAIKRLEFIIYSSISAGVAVLLAIASTTRAGDRFVLIDVGICAIFGAFTVLSTKAISSLLSRGNPLEMFRHPVTYPVLFVLAATAVAQITYLNRALQRFDSRQVIPVQFVLFTISAIVGSAVLYRDFENVEAHRMINFLFGCLTTFAGVFVLTRRNGDEEAHEESDKRRRRKRRAASRSAAERDSLERFPGKATDSWTSSIESEDQSAIKPDTPDSNTIDEQSYSETGAPVVSTPLKPVRPEDRQQRPATAIRFDEPQVRPDSSSNSLRRGRWLPRPSLVNILPLGIGSDTNVPAVSRRIPTPAARLGTSLPAEQARILSSSVPSPISPLSASMSSQSVGSRWTARPLSLVSDRPIAAAPTGLLSAGQYLLLPATLATPPISSRQARIRSLSQPATPVRRRSRRGLRDAAAAGAEESTDATQAPSGSRRRGSHSAAGEDPEGLSDDGQ